MTVTTATAGLGRGLNQMVYGNTVWKADLLERLPVIMYTQEVPSAVPGAE